MSYGGDLSRRRASAAVIHNNGGHNLFPSPPTFDLVNGRRGSMRLDSAMFPSSPDRDNDIYHLSTSAQSKPNLSRRRSLPKTPKRKPLNPQESDEVTPGLKWDDKQQAYVPNIKVEEDDNNRFNDQFDEYLYQSRHITTPIINVPPAPELVVEIPSDSDSSRRPSRVSISPSSRNSCVYSPSPRPSQAKIELDGLVIPGNKLISRRASHSGDIPQLQSGVNPQPSSLLKVPRGRTRGTSLPESIGSDDLYRLRNFSISGKRIINRGDSFRSRSVNSIGSSVDVVDSHHSNITTESPSTRSRDSVRSGSRISSRCNSRRSSRGGSRLSHHSIHHPPDSVKQTQVYRVLMLGAAGVGKTSLCAQFLSSDHINTYDRAAVEAEECIEKEVSVAVNDIESRVVFIDHQHGDMSLENMMMTYSPSAYIVVFAVDEKASLDQADRVLSYLRMNNAIEERPVILVANKTDLVRKRIIKTATGKNVAAKFGIKYIETSPGINHNVDELLVGVLTQISLREQNSNRRKTPSKVLNFFSRVLNLSGDQNKSCSNLNIL